MTLHRRHLNGRRRSLADDSLVESVEHATTARRLQHASDPTPAPAGGPRPELIADGPPPDVAGFGMKLFLASLTVLFGATFVAYGIMRWRNRDTWESVIDTPELLALAGATVLLVFADVASMRALKKASTRAAATRLTIAGAAAATLYLGVQLTSWLPIWARRDPITGGDLTMPDVVFMMITLAHAIHVAGGIIANVVVLTFTKSRGGPTRNGLRLLYQYWRFLTVMWVGVLAILAI